MPLILKYPESNGREASWLPLPDEKSALSQARSLVRQKCILVSLSRSDGSVIGQKVLEALIANIQPEPSTSRSP